ncbi:MAG: hypothetical protein ACRC4M_05260, partial [Mycoplasma sp.]
MNKIPLIKTSKQIYSLYSPFVDTQNEQDNIDSFFKLLKQGDFKAWKELLNKETKYLKQFEYNNQPIESYFENLSHSLTLSIIQKGISLLKENEIDIIELKNVLQNHFDKKSLFTTPNQY